VNVTADVAWRTGWLNCLPESPCKDISLQGVKVDKLQGTHGWECQHVEGRDAGGNSAVSPSAADCFSAH